MSNLSRPSPKITPINTPSLKPPPSAMVSSVLIRLTFLVFLIRLAFASTGVSRNVASLEERRDEEKRAPDMMAGVSSACTETLSQASKDRTKFSQICAHYTGGRETVTKTLPKYTTTTALKTVTNTITPTTTRHVTVTSTTYRAKTITKTPTTVTTSTTSTTTIYTRTIYEHQGGQIKRRRADDERPFPCCRDSEIKRFCKKTFPPETTTIIHTVSRTKTISRPR
ncbi:hypothetical protein C8J56DRAFT_78396 [Mycena floridula]|nr:hypothetical protein C8J56DRAFT_78396 [Mycena floridula]